MRLLVLALAASAALAAAPPVVGAPAGMTEVVVTLDAPSLARAVRTSRVLAAEARDRRLELGSAFSRGYLDAVAASQDEVVARVRAEIPSARVRWRYSVVLNGLAIWLPARELPQLARVAGIARVYPPGSFRGALDRSPERIGADELWNDPALPTSGEGVKIGIIDDGVDPSHPFFDPTGYVYPPGFPKGNREFTTPKVIVARAFAPATTTWKYARLPFDPQESEHGTHVAGIAAGNVLAAPVQGRVGVSGTAPRAYIGNYKALSTPSAFGLIDNAAEVVAAIEAAVRDGMDVINMSFGEYETDPSRSPVDAAVDGAATAGVVPVAAAGNAYDELGRGSIGSPASATRAIAVGAVTKAGALAGFSSGGPTGLSHRTKPDVSAPGVSVFSSVPSRLGSWASFSGTSMAAPHVAGAAALLRQRHPEWTVAEIASALVTTAEPARGDAAGGPEVLATREGGGIVDLSVADEPLVFARPYTLSFGLIRPGARAVREVELTDAGGGSGSWSASVRLQSGAASVTAKVPGIVGVPGRVQVEIDVVPGVADDDVVGFLVLERGNAVRRLPLWLRVAQPRLPAPAALLPGRGRYRGDTLRGRSMVASYRYPEALDLGTLRGPEQVFRVRVRAPVANLGVRVVSQAKGVRVVPRIVRAGDENRLAGVPALPMDVNPYREAYGEPRPTAAVVRPAPGRYDLVFDTGSRATAGAFTFRVWLDDTTPPRVRLHTASVGRNQDVVLDVSDAGSGVDPRSIAAAVDGRSAAVRLSAGRVYVRLDGRARPGRHRLTLTVADFQETKNSESVLGILPNTTVVRSSFTVRP